MDTNLRCSTLTTMQYISPLIIDQIRCKAWDTIRSNQIGSNHRIAVAVCISSRRGNYLDYHLYGLADWAALSVLSTCLVTFLVVCLDRSIFDLSRRWSYKVAIMRLEDVRPKECTPSRRWWALLRQTVHHSRSLQCVNRFILAMRGMIYREPQWPLVCMYLPIDCLIARLVESFHLVINYHSLCILLNLSAIANLI